MEVNIREKGKVMKKRKSKWKISNQNEQNYIYG